MVDVAANPDNLLLVLRHSPYGTSMARSSLDIALAAGAFEQPVTILFSGPGVLQLAPDQHGDVLGRKTLGKQLAAFPLYDIERVYADAGSLVLHSIDPTLAPVPVEALGADAVNALLRNHRHVMGL